MKNMSKKQKIILALIAIVIIAGIIVISITGFNFDLKYQEAKEIELNIQKEFNISEIKQITDEVIQGQEVIIQKVEVYEDAVRIIAKDISDEQKTQLITKVNEKYGISIDKETTNINTRPHTRGRDIIKPYITPLVVTTIIILAYLSIRYYRLNSAKVVIKSILSLVLIQILLFSIIAIIRIPVGRLTVPMIIVVYLLTLLGITAKFENNLLKVNKEES